MVKTHINVKRIYSSQKSWGFKAIRINCCKTRNWSSFRFWNCHSSWCSWHWSTSTITKFTRILRIDFDKSWSRWMCGELPPLFSTFSMKCSHHGNDMKVTEKNDFLSRSIMIKARNIIVKERIWTGSVTSKIETQLWDSNTDAQLHDERSSTVREEPSLHVESYHRRCNWWWANYFDWIPYVDPSREFKTARANVQEIFRTLTRYTGYKPNNVWRDLKHVRAHKHGEHSDLGPNYDPMWFWCQTAWRRRAMEQRTGGGLKTLTIVWGTGRALTLRIRDVVSTSIVSFNRVVQCTTDYTGHASHAQCSLSDFFMHNCCMVQDIEDRSFSALLSHENLHVYLMAWRPTYAYSAQPHEHFESGIGCCADRWWFSDLWMKFIVTTLLWTTVPRFARRKKPSITCVPNSVNLAW